MKLNLTPVPPCELYNQMTEEIGFFYKVILVSLKGALCSLFVFFGEEIVIQGKTDYLCVKNELNKLFILMTE